jgi:hypothetical protein
VATLWYDDYFPGYNSEMFHDFLKDGKFKFPKSHERDGNVISFIEEIDSIDFEFTFAYDKFTIKWWHSFEMEKDADHSELVSHTMKLLDNLQKVLERFRSEYCKVGKCSIINKHLFFSFEDPSPHFKRDVTELAVKELSDKLWPKCYSTLDALYAGHHDRRSNWKTGKYGEQLPKENPNAVYHEIVMADYIAAFLPDYLPFPHAVYKHMKNSILLKDAYYLRKSLWTRWQKFLNDIKKLGDTGPPFDYHDYAHKMSIQVNVQRITMSSLLNNHTLGKHALRNPYSWDDREGYVLLIGKGINFPSYDIIREVTYNHESNDLEDWQSIKELKWPDMGFLDKELVIQSQRGAEIRRKDAIPIYGFIAAICVVVTAVYGYLGGDWLSFLANLFQIVTFFTVVYFLAIERPVRG